MLVDRERARARFQKAIYWDLLAKLSKTGEPFDARLLTVDGIRIATGKDFDEATGDLSAEVRDKVRVLSEAEAQEILERIEKAPWTVRSVREKPNTSRPAPPFITSTLQQEANRKLGMSARDSMRTAQRLYEEGLITYMRTDSPNLSQEAISAARRIVSNLYGQEYLSPQPRQFTSKSKGAQEAHEAIRPAGAEFVHPRDSGLEGRDLNLYRMIWSRTVASQMADARKLSISVQIEAAGTMFGANGSRILFPGYLRAYVEGKDDPEAALEDREVLLPEMQEGDSVKLESLKADQHETKPPARFTEASLVQTLEREGIGRPSTYASIIDTILARAYARKVGNALAPTFTGFAVTQLLERNFSRLVDSGFTAQMEESLDEIAGGQLQSLPYLKRFYLGQEGLQNQVKTHEDGIDTENSRTVELPQIKDFQVKVGRYGPYVVQARTANGAKADEAHASIPEDVAPADLTTEQIREILEHADSGPTSIGTHPDSGQSIYCLLGRYGPYVQQGEATPENPKPRRASLPKGVDAKSITVDRAVELLSLPRDLGAHPESGKVVQANLGRFGPYVAHNGEFRSIPKGEDLHDITLDRALEILAIPKKERPGWKKKVPAEGDAAPKALVAKPKRVATTRPAKTRATTTRAKAPAKTASKATAVKPRRAATRAAG
ncbi:MAG: topoisomerase, partial [Abditibacteriota bacterium]|nr:topoisomerase [Abditibacteriota bacterium]